MGFYPSKNKTLLMRIETYYTPVVCQTLCCNRAAADIAVKVRRAYFFREVVLEPGTIVTCDENDSAVDYIRKVHSN